MDWWWKSTVRPNVFLWFVLVSIWISGQATSGQADAGQVNCEDKLGMEDGGISDDQITASSVDDGPRSHSEKFARLNRPHASGSAAGAWCADRSADQNSQWIQVEFPSTMVISGVIIQGRSDLKQWVTKFKVEYSDDNTWQYVMTENSLDEEQIFVGNSDQNTSVTQQLPQLISVKKIKIHPVNSYQGISMRFELLGCVDEGYPIMYNFPSNLSENSLSGKNFAIINWTIPNVFDNSGIVNVTSDKEPGSRFHIGTTKVTYTAVNPSGNETSCYFFVTIKDEEDPIFNTFPGNMSANTITGENFAIVNWTKPNATDNSGILTITSHFEPGSRFYIGANNVTYSAVDPSGNVANYSFVVMIIDEENPKFNNFTRNLSALSIIGESFAVVIWTKPTATDNSGIVKLMTNKEPGSRFYIGTTNVTYTAVDPSGNEASFSFLVTVKDKQATDFNDASGSLKTLANVKKFVQDWDELPLKLLSRSSEPVSLNMQSFVLKQFRFSSNNGSQEFVVKDENVTATVDISPPAVKYDSSMTLGILKSAHESMSLNESVQTNTTEKSPVFEFGSKITSISLFGNDGNTSRVLPLRNGTNVNMTVEFIIAMSSKTDSTSTQAVKPGCFFFNQDGYWSDEGCIVIEENISHVTCSCNHLTSFAVLMQLVDVEIPQQHVKALDILTKIVLAVSSVCLVITLVAFGFLRLYTKPRVIIHANLALSLLVGQLLFLFGTDATPKGACKAITVLLHYFYMAVFMWMLMEGVFLYNKLKPGMKWSMKPAVFMAVAWGVPLPITMIALAIRYNDYGSNGSCWLPIEKGIIFAFAGPAIIIIFVNVCILCMTLWTFQHLKANQDKSDMERMRASLRALAILTPLLGLTWIFGILQFNKGSAVVFSYVFVILNGSQGVLIFIAQCLLDEDVSKYLKKKIGRKIDAMSNNASAGDGDAPSTEMVGVDI